MSWQAYVDSSLVGSGHIQKAAIVSAAGDSTWAATPGFTFNPEELKTIVEILKGDGKGPAVDKAFADGIYLGGERYVATRIEDRSIYCRQGKTGICVAKTKQAILIAQHGEHVQAGNATQTVEALADYLIKSGY
ncbi:putative profilin [Diplogelasinospora grovesii]|uniref:Profilin n=1 Tax=Diplogelasinospora grovesii TaxID=303347 RepID=A0AAN6NDL0_9PEZI|nr:putative profilin [Diplogelasinospora grovesii]